MQTHPRRLAALDRPCYPPSVLTRAQRVAGGFLGLLIMLGWLTFAYGVCWLLDR